MVGLLRKIPALAILTLMLTTPTGVWGADPSPEILSIAVDPCTQPLAEELAYAYSTKTGTKFQIVQGKCKVGVDAARSGEALMGMTTQNIADLEPGLTKTVIAKAPIVFIVNSDNPIDSLTYAQLQKIMSGDIDNWKQLGGMDEDIHHVMFEPCVKETVAAQVLDAPAYSNLRMLAPEVKWNAVKDTNRMVERHKGAIGQQIYGYESKKVKVLAIDGMLPDAGNVPSKYRTYEDYNIIVKGAPAGRVADFIAFAKGPEGQKIAEEMKHIPVR